MLWLLLACTTGREPLAFDGTAEPAEPSACAAVDTLTFSVEHLWLQQPAELAWVPTLVSSAWAHPGHDPAGDVTGEILGPWTLDPCDAATDLGTGVGYTSAVATGQLTLLGPAHLLAELDGLPVDIEVELDHPVAGIPLRADLSDGAHVALRFDPTLTLSVLPLEDTDGDGVLTESDDGVSSALTYGLANPNSWTLSLESP